MSSVVSNELFPDGAFRKCLDVSDDDEEAPGTCEADVEALFVSEEANITSMVRPDAADDDDVFFTPLKSVDGVCFDEIFFTLHPL